MGEQLPIQPAAAPCWEIYTLRSLRNKWLKRWGFEENIQPAYSFGLHFSLAAEMASPAAKIKTAILAWESVADGLRDNELKALAVELTKMMVRDDADGELRAVAQRLLATYRCIDPQDVASWPAAERQLFADTFSPLSLAVLTRLAKG